MELIDLQASSFYKNKHGESSLQDFYKCLNKESFKNIPTLEKRSLFESIYFIYVNILATELRRERSSLTVGHLEDILKIFSSRLEPDYAELVACKRFHNELYF